MTFEFVKTWLIKYNLFRPFGYFFIFQFGFVLSTWMNRYIIEKDPAYYETMPVPKGGFALSILFNLALGIYLTYLGNKNQKPTVVKND
jgi:hypothetical protein